MMGSDTEARWEAYSRAADDLPLSDDALERAYLDDLALVETGPTDEDQVHRRYMPLFHFYDEGVGGGAGNRAKAEDILRRWIARLEALFGLDDPALVPPLTKLAAYIDYGSSVEEAGRLYRRAIAIAEGRLCPRSLALADALEALAQHLWSQGRRAASEARARYNTEAEALVRRALALRDADGSAARLDTVELLNQHGVVRLLALMLKEQRRHAEADELFARAAALRTRYHAVRR